MVFPIPVNILKEKSGQLPATWSNVGQRLLQEKDLLVDADKTQRRSSQADGQQNGGSKITSESSPTTRM
jgi:hypothetical protein